MVERQPVEALLVVARIEKSGVLAPDEDSASIDQRRTTRASSLATMCASGDAFGVRWARTSTLS